MTIDSEKAARAFAARESWVWDNLHEVEDTSFGWGKAHIRQHVYALVGEGSITDAEPGDIYVDPKGVLWRIKWTCAEPTLEAEAVEPDGYFDAPDGAIVVETGLPMTGTFLRRRLSGAISAPMWFEFRRVLRVAKP